MCCRLERGHRHLVHSQLAEHPAALHDRRGRLVDRAHGAVDRCGRRRCRAGGADRSAQAVQEGRRCRLDCAASQVPPQLGVVPQGLVDPVKGGRRLPTQLGRQRTEVRGMLLEVEQQLCDLQATDAVGERVVQLAHERCAVVGQPVDQGHLPEGPSAVELRHLGAPSELQDRSEVARRRSRHPSHAVAQVEVPVVHPPRRRRQQGRHHPLTEHRHLLHDPREAVDEDRPVR